jgi:hypothetical protein
MASLTLHPSYEGDALAVEVKLYSTSSGGEQAHVHIHTDGIEVSILVTGQTGGASGDLDFAVARIGHAFKEAFRNVIDTRKEG